jgi:hypothetical protein
VKYVEKSVPISSSRGIPVTWTVAALTSVMVPSEVIVTSGSSDASISERSYDRAGSAGIAVSGGPSTPVRNRSTPRPFEQYHEPV